MKNKSVSFLLLFAFAFVSLNQLFAQTMPAGADPKIWAQALKFTKRQLLLTVITIFRRLWSMMISICN
jgi:hypothetical protein